MEQLNVMIVEDELITAEAIAVLLEKLNYKPISIVKSGEEALSKIKDLNLDLILMDIILAGTLDGIEAAKIINNNYNIPIIFITAYGDKKTLDRAKLSEPYGYIVKPITNEEDLLPAIELAVYNHQVKTQLKEDRKKFEQIKKFIKRDKNVSSSQVKSSIEEGEGFEGSNKGLDPMNEIEVLGEKLNLVDWLKTISNPERFLILEFLKYQPLKLDEVEMLIDKSQSTSSHHLKKLEETGLIKGWKDGKYISYSLNKPKLMEFATLWENWLEKLSS
jgi:two-component system, response regulator PdtaR